MAYELDHAVREHYDVGVERNRLTTWGRLEAERTRELLGRFLPGPPAVVLDVGGAEGAGGGPATMIDACGCRAARMRLCDRTR